MTNIDRVRVALTGFPGGPGVATFYGLSGPALFPFVKQLWAALVVAMPPDVLATVEPVGDTINDTTGVLAGGWSIAGVAGDRGTGGSSYAAPVGMLIRWATDTILDGHRIKGRTFVVPISVGNFDTDGSMTPGSNAAYASAAAAYALGVANNGVIWHRPRFGLRPVGGGPRPITRSGGHALITGSSVADLAAVLRSRRD